MVSPKIQSKVSSVRSISDGHRELLGSLNESELTELVVLPLLEKMGFREIRRLHGKLELGKDIVATLDHPIFGAQSYAFALKAERISGDVRSNSSARNCILQLQQAIQEPWLHPDTGRQTKIKGAILITSHEITQDALISIQNAPDLQSGRISLLDSIQIIELIKKFCPDLLNSVGDHEIRYVESLARSVAHASSVSSIPTGNPVSLRKVYVGGRLATISHSDATQLSFASLSGEERENSKHLAEVLDAGHRCVCVVADVGAGKTSLLQKYVLDIADSVTTRNPGEKLTYPVLLRLATFQPTFRRNEQVGIFEKWFEQQLNSKGGDYTNLASADRRVVVLLDGFDEIPSEHDSVWSAIEHFASRYDVQFVVTTRPSRVPRTRLFSLFQLLPLSGIEIREFIGKWFTDASDGHASVVEAIESNLQLLQFCRTPLMLTLFAAIAKRTGVFDLPTSRTQFYTRAVNLLLTWDSSRGVVNVFPESVKSHFLQGLAFSQHSTGTKQIGRKRLTDISAASIKPIVSSPVANRKSSEAGSVDSRFLDELIYRSNLLKAVEDGMYEFTHLSFQEYFAALYSNKNGETPAIYKNTLDSWWRGVMLFAFGLLEKIPLECIKSLSKGRSLNIANAHFYLEYLAEAPYTDAQVKDSIYAVLAEQLLNDSLSSDALVAECRPNCGAMLTYLSSRHSQKSIDTFRLVTLACRFGGEAWRFMDPNVLGHLRVPYSDRPEGRFSRLQYSISVAMAARPRDLWMAPLSAFLGLFFEEFSRSVKEYSGGEKGRETLEVLGRSLEKVTNSIYSDFQRVTLERNWRKRIAAATKATATFQERLDESKAKGV